MRINRESAIGFGVSLGLIVGTLGASGCGSFSENENTSAPSKSTAAAGSTPGLPGLNTGEIRRGIANGSKPTEAELDQLIAESILRVIFQPEFLDRDLGGKLALKPAELQVLTQGENGVRVRRWQTIDEPDSKLSASVEATFITGGIISATVEGKLTGVFPWNEGMAMVKPGEESNVVDRMAKTFDLEGKQKTVYTVPQHKLPDSDELVDWVIGISVDDKILDGRTTSLIASTNGKFRYSIKER